MWSYSCDSTGLSVRTGAVEPIMDMGSNLRFEFEMVRIPVRCVYDSGAATLGNQQNVPGYEVMTRNPSQFFTKNLPPYNYVITAEA